MLRRGFRRAYDSCNIIADLGVDMRIVLDRTGHTCPRRVTLTPWSLCEPAQPVVADMATRRELFGDAALALLYSGNFGRAHSSDEFLALARCLQSANVGFCFSVRGNRVSALTAAVNEADSNIRLADFVPESDLETHLGSADILLVSLRPEWAGIVVPSKFFGALAVGRPVLFAGPSESSIAGIIREHKVGWVLNRESLDSVASEMRRLATTREELAALHRHCHKVYRDNFCRHRILDAWDQELRRLVIR
jgi:glycosyltransferase involved in cell wall biosynthesis